jgi:hypothetical protein
MSVEVTDAGLVRSTAGSTFDGTLKTAVSYACNSQVVLGDTSISCGMPADRIQALNSRMDALCPVGDAATPESGKTGGSSVPRRRVRCTSVMQSGSGVTCLLPQTARCCIFVSNRQPSHRRVRLRARSFCRGCAQMTRYPITLTTADIVALAWSCTGSSTNAEGLTKRCRLQRRAINKRTYSLDHQAAYLSTASSLPN